MSEFQPIESKFDKTTLLSIVADINHLIKDGDLIAEKIEPGLYKSTDEKDKKKFEKLSKNKLRKVWFTKIFLMIQEAADLLNNIPRHQKMAEIINKEEDKLRKKIVRAEETDEEMVKEAQGLAGRVAGVLEELTR